MVLKITQEQMHKLSQVKVKRFADELKRYALEEFRNETRDLSRDKLDRLISHTLVKTKSYGFTDKSHICKYLNIMFIHGVLFDEKCSWAKAVLSDQKLNTAHLRMHRLYNAAIENA